MKKVLSLVMILILSLTACGGKGGGDPMIRISENISVRKYSGDGSNWFSLSEIFDEGESYIELKDGGKGVFCLGGDATDIKWMLESDGTLKLTQDSLESNGTLKDGMITLTDLWGNEVTITFRKEGRLRSGSNRRCAARLVERRLVRLVDDEQLLGRLRGYGGRMVGYLRQYRYWRG